MTGNQADTAIAFARAQLGKPYEWGETGPNGYDCSGLVYAAYRSAGVSIGRTTYTQIFNGTAISKSDLMPGDLVFPDPGHVQLYVGGDQVIEAPHTGANVREVQMWGFWAARRVTTPATGGSGGTPVTTVGTVTVGAPSLGQIWAVVVGIYHALSKVGDAVGWLTHAQNWLRVGIFVLGAVLALVALERATGATAAATKAVKGVSSVVG